MQATHFEGGPVKHILRLLLVAGLISLVPSNASAWGCKRCCYGPAPAPAFGGGGVAMMPTFIPVGVAGAGGAMQLSMGLSMSGDAAGLMVPVLVRLAQRLFGTTD